VLNHRTGDCRIAVLFGRGLVLVRRRVLPRLRIQAENSAFSAAMVERHHLVFYGLAVALIAVSVFQTYSDVSKVISGEGDRPGRLYRDVSIIPTDPPQLQMNS